jgi:hypothetical protein
MRTGRQTGMTKLIVAFCSSPNAPNKDSLHARENTVPIIKISRLVLFRKLIGFHCENQKLTNMLCGKLRVSECHIRWYR